jgi:hypothetical protein
MMNGRMNTHHDEWKDEHTPTHHDEWKDEHTPYDEQILISWPDLQTEPDCGKVMQ